MSSNCYISEIFYYLSCIIFFNKPFLFIFSSKSEIWLSKNILSFMNESFKYFKIIFNEKSNWSDYIILLIKFAELPIFYYYVKSLFSSILFEVKEIKELFFY